MTLATRGVLGQGYAPAAPTEWQYAVGTLRSWSGLTPALVYCHGSGDSTLTALAKTGQRPLIDALAQRYAVVAADLGLQAWGNDTHVERIADAVTFIQASTGATSRVVLVAGSMGALGALGYARLHPEKVRAVAAIIPALDLADLMLRGAAGDIDAAYGGAYDDATHGPTHSPVKYAGQLDPSLRVHLWTCNDDTICTPPTADAFVAARPQTIRTNLGALGHSEAAVTAAQASVLGWLAST